MIDEWVLKVCLVGDSNLKTKLAEKIGEERSPALFSFITGGVDLIIKRITVNTQKMKLLMMVFPSHEIIHKKYTRIRERFLREAKIFIVFFEKHDDSSFGAVPAWIDKLRSFIPEEVPMTLVGLISKEPERVPHAYARKYALYWGIDFQTIKSMDDLSFEYILEDVIQRYIEKLAHRKFLSVDWLFNDSKDT
jgi:GTPase SAR1 family protein